MPRPKMFETEKFGQKQWEIRANTMGNSGKNNGKFVKKQWEVRAKAIIFARNNMPPLSEFSHRFCPNFPIAFSRISHCVCPNFPLLFPEIRAKASGNSGKSNGKIWAKQCALGKRWDIISGKNYGSFGQFHEMTYYFQNLLLRSD